MKISMSYATIIARLPSPARHSSDNGLDFLPARQLRARRRPALSPACRDPPGADRRRNLSSGAPLPKEADIAGRFGISLITVRQALRELESRRPDPQACRQAGGSRRPRAGAEAQPRLPQLRRHGGIHARRAAGDRQLSAGDGAGGARGLRSRRTRGLPYCLRGILVVGDGRRRRSSATFRPRSGSA